MCPIVFQQNAHLVTSSVTQDGVCWPPEDAMASPTVTMTAMRKTVVCVCDGTFLEYTNNWLG